MVDRSTLPLARSVRAADLASPELASAAIGAAAAPGLTRYPGGKNGAGVWQRLISLMPPHRVYVEAFLGSGAILRRKRPAGINIGIDADPGVIAAHGEIAGANLVCSDALEWLRDRNLIPDDALIYCDPPYLGASRSRQARALYEREMLGENEHAELLRILTSLPAMVAISGYACPLYDQALSGWERVEYLAMTRGGPRPEVVWMNYPPPTELHDYRFLGRDFHDRCRIGRKIARWTRRLATMAPLERAAVLSGLGLCSSSAAPGEGGRAVSFRQPATTHDGCPRHH